MKLINSNYIYLSSPSTYLYILKMLLSIHYTYFGLYLQNLKWLQMKLLFIGPNGNVNKGSLRLVCSKNASNVCLLQLNWKISLHDNDNKRLTIIWDDRKDNDFFSSCFKILHYLCTYIKKSYFESENEIQKTCRLFCSKSRQQYFLASLQA